MVIIAIVIAAALVAVSFTFGAEYGKIEGYEEGLKDAEEEYLGAYQRYLKEYSRGGRNK